MIDRLPHCCVLVPLFKTGLEDQSKRRLRDAIMRRLPQIRTMHLKLEIIEDSSRWDNLLLSLPSPHLVQSWTWGEVKARFGWQPRRLHCQSGVGVTVAAGQLLTRVGRLSGGLKVAYCPKGQILNWGEDALQAAVLSALIEAAQLAAVRRIAQTLEKPESHNQ